MKFDHQYKHLFQRRQSHFAEQTEKNFVVLMEKKTKRKECKLKNLKSILPSDLAFFAQINFVPNQSNLDVIRCIFFHVMQPFLHMTKRYFIRNIVDQYNALSSAIILFGYRPKKKIMKSFIHFKHRKKPTYSNRS